MYSASFGFLVARMISSDALRDSVEMMNAMVDPDEGRLGNIS
jgi:hypothetical protein